MDLLYALIFGIVEGLSEFLPISSTGHLIVLSHILNVNQDSFHKSFEIVIQLAAILSVVSIYFRDLFNFQNMVKLSIAFIPTGLVGFFLYKHILELFSINIIAIMFIIGGIILILVDILKPNHNEGKSIEEISLKESLIIGLVQTLSLIPGTSRSGAAIFGGILVKMDKVSSAKFSFLLGVPTILVASGYETIKNYQVIFNTDKIDFLIVGFVVSYVMALVSLKLMITIVKKVGFSIFGIYRILFGILLFYYI